MKQEERLAQMRDLVERHVHGRVVWCRANIRIAIMIREGRRGDGSPLLAKKSLVWEDWHCNVVVNELVAMYVKALTNQGMLDHYLSWLTAGAKREDRSIRKDWMKACAEAARSQKDDEAVSGFVVGESLLEDSDLLGASLGCEKYFDMQVDVLLEHLEGLAGLGEIRKERRARALLERAIREDLVAICAIMRKVSPSWYRDDLPDSVHSAAKTRAEKPEEKRRARRLRAEMKAVD